MKVTQSCPTLCNSIVHGILQARILEWVAFPFSRGSSQPWGRTQVSCIASGFTSWATREAQEYWSGWTIPSPADLPGPGIKPGSSALQVDSLPTELSGSPNFEGKGKEATRYRVFIHSKNVQPCQRTRLIWHISRRLMCVHAKLLQSSTLCNPMD